VLRHDSTQKSSQKVGSGDDAFFVSPEKDQIVIDDIVFRMCRLVTLVGTDHLTADFSANNVGGRVEGGYRFALPGMLGLAGRYGFTPYAAAQAQAFRTPSYSESAASGSSIFALAYNARTTTTARSELGGWFDWRIPTQIN
jgi:uncharacterized protein with beta-barrel porin domain